MKRCSKLSGKLECNHIFLDGKRCQNPCENRKHYCFWHTNKSFKRVQNNEKIKKAFSLSLREAYLVKADIVSNNEDSCICFDNKDLQDSNFEGAKIKNVSFSGSNLRNASFKGAVLEKVLFRNADLSGAIFEDTVCNDVDFKEAKLEDAIFRNASFVKTKINEILKEEYTAMNSEDNERKIELYKKAMNLYFQFEKAFRPYDIKNADISWKKYQKIKTTLHWLQFLHHEEKNSGKLKHLFLWVSRKIFGFTSGYGEKPLNVVCSSLLTIVIFWAIISKCHFSLTSLETSLNAFIGSYPKKLSILLVVENYFGYGFLSLFIVSLTRKLFK